MKEINNRTKGIVSQKQEGYFTIRVVGKCGIFKSEEMMILSNIASEFGNGELSLTSRLTVEIPYIKGDNIDKAVKIIEESGLVVDCGGYTVRNVISCKGSICKFGLIDTHKIAIRLQDEFFGKKLPNKLKIGVFGCKNGAGRAEASDIGILPVRKVKLVEEKCIKCGICMKKCPDNAIVNNQGIYEIDYHKCVNCGRCINFCNKDAIEGEDTEVQVFIGGRNGRGFSEAIKLNRSFKEEEILEVVEAIINYFNENALPKERFASLIERVGFKNVEEYILRQSLNSRLNSHN